MTKIEKLTAQQEKDLIDFREQWLEKGLSTNPIDFDKSKKIISNFYERIGKKAPIFLKFSSPMVAQLAMNVIRKKGDELRVQLWDQLGDQLWDQLRVQLWDQLGGQLQDQLGGQLWDQLRGQLWDQLRGQLGDQLRGQLRGQLWDQLQDQLGDQLRGQLRGQLWDQLRVQLGDQLRDQLQDQLGDQNLEYFTTWLIGSLDSYWIAHYLFAQKIGVQYTKEQSELLNLWAELAESAFFWYPFQNFCFLSERPTKIHFDDSKRLHNENSAAVEFVDGYSLYAWHGIRVEEWIIKNPELITIEKINAEENTEMRRVMCERYGWERYFKDRLASGKCKLLDTKEVWGQPVNLYQDNDDEVERHFVHVINGTVEKDGSRHQFIINCKNIDNDAEKSVYGTYPELIDRIKLAYPETWLQELRNSIRT